MKTYYPFKKIVYVDPQVFRDYKDVRYFLADELEDINGIYRTIASMSNNHLSPKEKEDLIQEDLDSFKESVVHCFLTKSSQDLEIKTTDVIISSEESHLSELTIAQIKNVLTEFDVE